MNTPAQLAILRALRDGIKAGTRVILSQPTAPQKPGCKQAKPCPKLARRGLGR